MRFEHEFSVAAPIDDVWSALGDIERVAPCVPNTRVMGRAGPDAFDVEISASVGPFALTATGTITIAERDDGYRRTVLQVVARDPDGGPLAELTVTIALTHDGTATHGAVSSTVAVHGLGTLIAEQTLGDAAGRTLRTFAANLEALLRPAA